jgi:hypothetical protein
MTEPLPGHGVFDIPRNYQRVVTKSLPGQEPCFFRESSCVLDYPPFGRVVLPIIIHVHASRGDVR